MKVCELCKKQPATIHLTDIKNGVKTETHICAPCAASKGLNLAAAQALPTLLEAMSAKKKAARRAAARDEGPACPRCGLAWGEFRAKGRLGCPHDYAVFRERLAPMLLDMHGREAVHVGRGQAGFAPFVPLDADADAGPTPAPAPAPVPASMPAPLAAPIPDAASEKRRKADERLKRLRKQLEKAVAGERYEEAARLRDEIAGLSGSVGD